jgi:hypothetical protein
MPGRGPVSRRRRDGPGVRFLTQPPGVALADLVALLLVERDGQLQLVLGLATPAAQQQHLGQVDVGLGPRVELVGLGGGRPRPISDSEPIRHLTAPGG